MYQEFKGEIVTVQMEVPIMHPLSLLPYTWLSFSILQLGGQDRVVVKVSAS